MRKLFKFNFDCGRMGELDGLFIATKEEVDKIIGKYAYFGEVLGKHSEIEGVIEKSDIKEISNDQELINKLEKVFGLVTLCGINPLYCDYEEDD